eukprot:7611448-Lingulodinium_polyedra.AAC.1
MARRQHDRCSCQKAWAVLWHSTSRALDYDARLVEPALLRPLLEELCEATRQCVAGLLGEGWGKQSLERAALPT